MIAEAAEAYEEDDPTEEQQVYTSTAAQSAVYQPFTYQTAEAVVASTPIPRDEIEDLTLSDPYEMDSEVDSTQSGTWSHSTSYGSEDDVDREKEMKIAFISKKSEESQSHDFKNYIHKNDGYRRSDDNDREAGNPGYEDTRSAVEETSPADVLEWKKLFLSETEEQKFKKVRIVIVQKEETLETIAKRYDRKPQEIKLYNRLQELDISAGQVIYIP
jgi:stage VI sporulation protein D